MSIGRAHVRSIIPYRITMLLLTLLLGLALYGFARSIWESPAELSAYDMLLRMRPAQTPRSDVVIVAVDPGSIAALGQPPWSRAVYGRIVSALRRNGARVIAFDIPLSSPDATHPGGDASFTRALAGGRDAVLPMVYDTLRPLSWNATDLQELVLLERYVITGRIIYPSDAQLYRYYYFVPPWVGFMQSARGVGVTINPVIEQTTVRSVNLAYLSAVQYPIPSQRLPENMPLPDLTDQTVVVPGLPLVIAELAWDVSNEPVQVDLGAGRIVIVSADERTVEIPVDRTGAMLVNYSGPAGSYQAISASQLLDGSVAEGLIAGRIVLVGITDPSTSAVMPTPYGSMSRTEITANAVGTILGDRYIVRTPTDAVIVLVLLSVLLGLVFPLVDRWELGVTALAVALTYVVLSAIVLTAFGHAWPVIPSILLIILSAVAMALLNPVMFASEFVPPDDES